jgi:hypothetical protein
MLGFSNILSILELMWFGGIGGSLKYFISPNERTRIRIVGRKKVNMLLPRCRLILIKRILNRGSILVYKIYYK